MPMATHREAPIEPLTIPAPDFDVRDYARTAVGNLREALDLEAYISRPLSAATLRILRYLQGLERATMQHLRGVLVTPTHKDARVTAFLTTWAFEKFWIADAIGAILDEHSNAPVAVPLPAKGIGAVLHALRERLSPIRESMVANAIGVDMIAVHMTVGTIDEWLSQAAYGRLAELEPHPELVRIVDTILGIKERHLSFLDPQARHRLIHAPSARPLTRRRINKTVWPIGAAESARAETAFFFAYLFSKAQDVIDDIDARIDLLPGLSGLGLIRHSFGTSA
jgi:hypothetical protein